MTDEFYCDHCRDWFPVDRRKYHFREERKQMANCVGCNTTLIAGGRCPNRDCMAYDPPPFPGRVPVAHYSARGGIEPVDLGESRSPEPPPKHYTTDSGMQPWHVVDAFGLDYYLGSCLKYLLRAGKKGPRLLDLKKARNFLDAAIERECDR